jgi:hypothetical protein
MIVIGLVLMAAGVALTVAMLTQNTGPTTLDIFGMKVDGTQAGLFIAGAAAMLAFLIGFYLVRLAVARGHRRRTEVRTLRRERHDESQKVQAERARLEQERLRLAEEKARLASAAGTGDQPTRAGGSTAYGDRVDLTGRERRAHTDH